VPFDAATLAALYPSQDAYVDAVTESADAAVAAGFLRQDDADEMIAAAAETTLGEAAAGVSPPASPGS